ncbi:hypothetical protein Tco_0066329 [Tanacetum coccineum]
MYTIEERLKLLAEFFEKRKKLLAEERAAAVRNKPPTRTQMRSLMMTYLKHTGRYRHNQLNKKTFEEIQTLYIKEQERDADFVPIGFEKDENIRKSFLKNLKVLKLKLSNKGDKTDSDIKKENDELRLCLTIASDEDKEVNYEIIDKKYPIIEWKYEYHGIKPQFNETKDLEEININVLIRRVHTLVTDAGLVIHMLVEKKYPLRKKVLLQMLELKLESKEDITMALELIRFVKKLIIELEPENSDGDGKDL